MTSISPIDQLESVSKTTVVMILWWRNYTILVGMSLSVFTVVQRRLPFHQRQEVHQLLDGIRKQGIIEEGNGPWSSPVVLAQKKDGSICFCVDFRNKKDAYPLPRIQDILDTLREVHWFSTLDLGSGYWQAEVDPADKQKTVFAIPVGFL